MASLLGRLFAPLETGIRDQNKRQRFRRLQHKIFGLNEREWEALETYICGIEAMHIIMQRDGWFRKDLERLADTSAGLSRDHPVFRETYMKFLDLRPKVVQNAGSWGLTVDMMKDAEHRIRHTPIFRALSYSREHIWLTSRWFRLKCIELGGCCSRGCRCCFKPRCPGMEDWEGGSHCTPACACCGKYNGLTRPIDNLEYPRQLTFDVNPDKADGFSNMMMNNVVWNIKGAT